MGHGPKFSLTFLAKYYNLTYRCFWILDNYWIIIFNFQEVTFTLVRASCAGGRWFRSGNTHPGRWQVEGNSTFHIRGERDVWTFEVEYDQAKKRGSGRQKGERPSLN